ncbi:MAG TPA: hypothetical protein VI542_25000 [Candidatus Tectomicrobia bacterium]
MRNSGAQSGAKTCATWWTTRCAIARVRSPTSIAHVDRQQHLALGVQRDPHPLGCTLQARDGLGLIDLPVFHGTEESTQLIKLHLVDPHVVQEVLHEGPQLLGRLHEPLQHRVGVHLEHPRRAPDTQAFGQARDDMHDAVDSDALAVKDRAEGLEKIATTHDTQQLPPGTTTGMAIGAEIAPAHPVLVPTVRIRAEMGGGIDLASSPPRGHDAWWSCGGLRAGAVACSQVSQSGFVVRPAKGLGSRLRFGSRGGGSAGGGHTAAGSLGHIQWSMRHSHTRATSTS